LVVGFAAVSVVLVMVVAGLFVTVDRLGDAHLEVAGPASALSRSSDGIRVAAADLRAAQQAYVLDEGASRPAFAAASRAFDAALESLRAAVIDDVDRALVDKIATGYQTFVVTDQLAWEALQRGERTLAQDLVLGPEGLAFGFMAADAATTADRAQV